MFSFSGSVGTFSVNEAQVVALKTNLKECDRLGLSSILLEGDFWCDICCSLGPLKPPLCLADVVEEVRETALWLDVTFTLLLRSANAAADLLAKEGVWQST